jgi:hypothetical protein
MKAKADRAFQFANEALERKRMNDSLKAQEDHFEFIRKTTISDQTNQRKKNNSDLSDYNRRLSNERKNQEYEAKMEKYRQEYS